MSNQSVITQKNYPGPLEVLGDHAAVLASGAGEMVHRLKEDIRSWYTANRRPPPDTNDTNSMTGDIPLIQRDRIVAAL